MKQVSSIFGMFQTIHKFFFQFFQFFDILHVEIRGGMNFFLKIFFPEFKKFSGISVWLIYSCELALGRKKFFWTHPLWLGDPLLYNQTTRRTQLRLDVNLCPILKHVGPLPPCLNGSSTTLLTFPINPKVRPVDSKLFSKKPSNKTHCANGKQTGNNPVWRNI